MNDSFQYVFPTIRGVQAGKEYYASMCPLRLIPRLFTFDEEELVPEIRAQRTLNKGRIPELARYISDNPDSYVFSAITASINSEVKFVPVGGSAEGQRMGTLHIPMTAKFVINDGQHRRAAIEVALKERPELGDESIAVVFFLDIGLERCQQMFADLNRYSIRPSRSIGILYDHRDKLSLLTKRVAFESPTFRDLVDMERSTLSARSRKLFTLSTLYNAVSSLVADHEEEPEEVLLKIILEYWVAVDRQIVEWKLVREAKLTAGDIRRDFVHSHGIGLHALGEVGNQLIWGGAGWKRKLSKLKDLDWSRSNTSLWEGRAMIGGRISKTVNNQTLTINAIKKHLSLPLTPEGQRVEDAYLRGNDG